MMVVDRRANIPHLVKEHLKTLTMSRHIEKILHAIVRELLVKSDSASILIVLKNASQIILAFHHSGVWFQDGGQ